MNKSRTPSPTKILNAAVRVLDAERYSDMLDGLPIPRGTSRVTDIRRALEEQTPIFAATLADHARAQS